MEPRQLKANFILRRAQYLAILWAIFSLSACGPTTTSESVSPQESSHEQQPSAPSPQGSATASTTLPSAPQTTISVDARSLPQERLQVFEEQGGAESLLQGISREITKKGKQFGPEPTEIHVTVTQFRLRSTASSVWFGMMAGADILDVRVAVTTNGETKKTFDTGVGGAVGGLIKPTAEGRFEGLVEVVSERIVQDL